MDLAKQAISMCNHIRDAHFRTSLIPAVMSFLPMLALVTSTGLVVRPALAEDGASKTAPPLQSGSSYWTKQRMRSAKPLMPAVPGTPHGGSAVSGPSGPSGGASGQGPQVQPNADNR